jgi:hypothetical protein
LEQLRPWLWTWTGRHPSWTPDEADWGPEVRSYAVDLGGRRLLFDPITPPQDLLRPAERAVVLTCAWHARSARDVGARVHGVDDPLPQGVEAEPAFFPEERTLWLADGRALIVGDSLHFEEGDVRPVPDRWLTDSSVEEYKAKLRPLLDLPIDLLLLTHGEPIVEDARGRLERALA